LIAAGVIPADGRRTLDQVEGRFIRRPESRDPVSTEFVDEAIARRSATGAAHLAVASLHG
jgi:hypothetical protein